MDNGSNMVWSCSFWRVITGEYSCINHVSTPINKRRLVWKKVPCLYNSTTRNTCSYATSLDNDCRCLPGTPYSYPYFIRTGFCKRLFYLHANRITFSTVSFGQTFVAINLFFLRNISTSVLLIAFCLAQEEGENHLCMVETPGWTCYDFAVKLHVPCVRPSWAGCQRRLSTVTLKEQKQSMASL